MKAQSLLNQVKELLGMEVKLAQMKLEDGAVIEAEAFEAGNEVFIVTEEDRIAVPVGSYVMEDRKVLVIEEEGVIAEIRDAEAEESGEELNEDKMEYASKEELAEVKSAIDELRQAIEAMKPEEEKEEMSETKDEVKEEVKEELSKEEPAKEELSAEPKKEELSEEFVHSPEAEVDKKLGFKLESRGKMGTQDVIFEKLFG